MNRLPNWIRIGALGGVAFLMTLGLVLLQALIPKAEAGTLTGLNVFVFNETVGLHTKLNQNFAKVATSVNNIDNSQIAANANISQSKIAGLSTLQSGFNDHSARHEPGGADEVGDIDILNTGTLLSAHAPRHAFGGADPLGLGSISITQLSAGVQALLATGGGRAPQVAETSTLTDTTYIGDVRSPFSGTSLSDGAMVQMTYCFSGGVGMLYLTENNTTTDRVHRILTTTMTSASPATVDLGVGAQPVDMVCAPDGNVYVLDNGTIFKVIKKIDSAGTATTFYDLTTARNVDNVSRIFVDPNGTSLLVIGQDTTIAEDRMLFKMTIADPTIGGTLTLDGDTDTTARDGFFLKRDGVFRFLALLEEGIGSDNCCLRPVDSSVSPPTASVGGDCDGANDIELLASEDATNINCNSVLFDGQALILSGVVNAAAGPTEATTFLMDSKINQGTKLVNPLWVENSTEIDGNPRFGVFTGRFFAWQRSNSNTFSAGQVNILESPLYTVGMAMMNLDYRAGLGGTPGPAGISTDGTNLYVATKRTDGSTAFKVTKNLMN